MGGGCREKGESQGPAGVEVRGERLGGLGPFGLSKHVLTFEQRAESSLKPAGCFQTKKINFRFQNIYYMLQRHTISLKRP